MLIPQLRKLPEHPQPHRQPTTQLQPGAGAHLLIQDQALLQLPTQSNGVLTQTTQDAEAIPVLLAQIPSSIRQPYQTVLGIFG